MAKPELIILDDVKRILGNAPDSHHFKLHLGTNIKNLRELVEALDIMSDDSFSHHVSKTKNDFSNWIGDILMDKELAERIKKVHDRKKMREIIRDRMHFLESNITEGKVCPHHFQKCGVGEFTLGMVVGFLVGLIIAVFV